MSALQVHQALGLTASTWVWAPPDWHFLAKCQTLVSSPVVHMWKMAYEITKAVHAFHLPEDFVSEVGAFSSLCITVSTIRCHVVFGSQGG